MDRKAEIDEKLHKYIWEEWTNRKGKHRENKATHGEK